jgi:hypothetical protein
MDDYWGDGENMIQTGKIKVPYTWQAGETASHYFKRLRDEQKILGKHCPQCDKVLVPPRKNCPFCTVLTDEWVELAGTGTVDTFTVVRRGEPIHPMKPPFAYALIRLDGADTGFLHVLGEVDPDTIQEGMRVEPVFAGERIGSPMDIAYFRPMG